MKAALVHYQKDTFSEFSHLLYEMGIAGLLISFPFLVMPFSMIFGIIIIAFLLYGLPGISSGGGNKGRKNETNFIRHLICKLCLDILLARTFYKLILIFINGASQIR
jgi:hypothetical protein